MKKTILVLLMILSTFFLVGCGVLRERLLAPPEKMEVPSDALIAICTTDDHVYSYVYRGGVIYLYYIDDELQGETKLSEIQDEIIHEGENTDNYLTTTYYTDECVIDEFVDEREWHNTEK